MSHHTSHVTRNKPTDNLELSRYADYIDYWDHPVNQVKTDNPCMSHHSSHVTNIKINWKLTSGTICYTFLESLLHQDHNWTVMITIMHATSSTTCHMTWQKFNEFNKINVSLRMWHLFRHYWCYRCFKHSIQGLWEVQSVQTICVRYFPIWIDVQTFQAT